MAKKKVTFEQALKELEGVVDRMETGDLPLEQCLEQYEKGVLLAQFCAKELDAAEKRIEKLRRKEDGSFATEPLEAVDAPGEATDDEEEPPTAP